MEASPEDATLPSHTPPTSVDGHPIGTPYNGTTGVVPSGPPATPAGQLPVCPVTVQIHHMGQYSFKGTPDKFELCQAMPASLSERRASYLDVAVNSNGKLLCIRKDDSMALSVSVMLPDILHLPLAAEPPLYLNVLQAHTHSSKTVI